MTTRPNAASILAVGFTLIELLVVLLVVVLLVTTALPKWRTYQAEEKEMTKKLEETFNINPIEDEEETEETPTVEESKELTEILNAEITSTEKIDAALPMVTDLNEHDREMDEIHKKALHAFDELFGLGMNVEVHAGAKLMETANQMLKTAMEAKDSKVDRKLKMLNLQMQKAKLDHQIDKEEKKHAKEEDDFETEGSVVMDRNELMKRLSKAQSKIDDSDK